MLKKIISGGQTGADQVPDKYKLQITYLNFAIFIIFQA